MWSHQFHGFKFHIYIDDSEMYTFSYNIFPELQIHLLLLYISTLMLNSCLKLSTIKKELLGIDSVRVAHLQLILLKIITMKSKQDT